ncbi:hypothetical protein CL616_00295 [archaeon]|nr:hypothetical protein [archaeon]|tara:strand:- start:424 stop:1170 length:747 start_codon:yes stop_codon:yes gene_type:complete
MEDIIDLFTEGELERLGLDEEELEELGLYGEERLFKPRKKSFSEVNRTFEDRRKVGSIGERFVLKYLAGREDTAGLRNVANNPDYFSKGIDVLWYTDLEGDDLFFGRDAVDMVTERNLVKVLKGDVNGRGVGVEVKTTLRVPYGKNYKFAFQTLSDVNSRRKGWLYTSQADRLVVFHLGARTLHTFNFPVLRDCLDSLEVGRQGVSLHDQVKRNGSKVFGRSRFLYVPIELIKKEYHEALDYNEIKLE